MYAHVAMFLLVCHALTQNDAESPVSIFLPTFKKRSKTHVFTKSLFIKTWFVCLNKFEYLKNVETFQAPKHDSWCLLQICQQLQFWMPFVHFCDDSAGKTSKTYGKWFDFPCYYTNSNPHDVLRAISTQRRRKVYRCWVSSSPIKRAKYENVQMQCQPSRLSSPSRWKPIHSFQWKDQWVHLTTDVKFHIFLMVDLLRLLVVGCCRHEKRSLEKPVLPSKSAITCETMCLDQLPQAYWFLPQCPGMPPAKLPSS